MCHGAFGEVAAVGDLPFVVHVGSRTDSLAALVESGSITPIVDKVFTVDNAAEAIRYLEVEHARAKVIIGFS